MCCSVPVRAGCVCVGRGARVFSLVLGASHVVHVRLRCGCPCSQTLVAHPCITHAPLSQSQSVGPLLGANITSTFMPPADHHPLRVLRLHRAHHRAPAAHHHRLGSHPGAGRRAAGRVRLPRRTAAGEHALRGYHCLLCWLCLLLFCMLSCLVGTPASLFCMSCLLFSGVGLTFGCASSLLALSCAVEEATSAAAREHSKERARGARVAWCCSAVAHRKGLLGLAQEQATSHHDTA